MKTGIELIAEERERQVLKEGWTPAHDDSHEEAELTRAAMSYADSARKSLLGGSPEHVARSSDYWPWDLEWWKPSSDPVRNLVKAGALIAAEIDRIERRRATKGQ